MKKKRKTTINKQSVNSLEVNLYTLGGRGFITVVAPNVTKDLIPVMVNSEQGVEGTQWVLCKIVL